MHSPMLETHTLNSLAPEATLFMSNAECRGVKVTKARNFLDALDLYGLETYTVPAEVSKPPVGVRVMVDRGEELGTDRRHCFGFRERFVRNVLIALRKSRESSTGPRLSHRIVNGTRMGTTNKGTQNRRSLDESAVIASERTAPDVIAWELCPY
jgi:hypothetical protein